MKKILITLMLALSILPAAAVSTQPSLKIFVPKAPPSLPLLYLEKKGYDIEIVYYSDVTTEVLPDILKNGKALYIIPSNVSAKLYSKGRRLTQLSVSSMGIVKIITSSPEIRTLKDADGKDVHVPAPGSSPDVIARFIFGESGISPVLKYGSTTEITQLFLAGKISTAVLPEPMASLVLEKNGNARVISDTKKDWSGFVKGSSGIPQVGICGGSAYVKENEKAVRLFLDDYGKAVKKVNSSPAEAAEKGRSGLEISLPATVLARSIPEMNLVHITGGKAYDELVKYFEVLLKMDPSSIGDSVPDGNFMFR